MRIPKKYQHMIEYIEWEEVNDHYWVELNNGWVLDGAHCFGEDTQKEIWETMERVEAEQ